MKRFFSLDIAIVFCFVLVAPCFFIAHAYTGGMIYSNLPEPIEDHYTKIFLLCPSETAFNNSNIPPLLYVFHAPNIHESVDFDVQWSLDSNSHWYWWVHFYDNSTNTNVNNYFYLFQYNALSGAFVNSSTWQGSANYSYSTAYTNDTMPYYQSYGITLDLNTSTISGVKPSLATPYWSFAATNNWLSQIVNVSLSNILQVLNSVNTNSAAINNIQLQKWNTYLDQVDIIKSKLDTINTSINSQCTQIRSQLSNIYSRLNDIYELLGGGEEITTLPQESGVHNSVNEYGSNEDSHMQNFDNNMDSMGNAFNDVGEHFSNLSDGFNFVKNVFESFVSNFQLPYILLIFTLTFGLLITLIGRKI